MNPSLYPPFIWTLVSTIREASTFTGKHRMG